MIVRDHYLFSIFFFLIVLRKEENMGRMIKEIQVDIPEWCDGCLSFDLQVKERLKTGEKIFSCSNLTYCSKARKAYQEATTHEA